MCLLLALPIRADCYQACALADQNRSPGSQLVWYPCLHQLVPKPIGVLLAHARPTSSNEGLCEEPHVLQWLMTVHSCNCRRKLMLKTRLSLSRITRQTSGQRTFYVDGLFPAMLGRSTPPDVHVIRTCQFIGKSVSVLIKLA